MERRWQRAARWECLDIVGQQRPESECHPGRGTRMGVLEPPMKDPPGASVMPGCFQRLVAKPERAITEVRLTNTRCADARVLRANPQCGRPTKTSPFLTTSERTRSGSWHIADRR